MTRENAWTRMQKNIKSEIDDVSGYWLKPACYLIFYGQLLSERQRQVMELYYEENLSLGEIAERIQHSLAKAYMTHWETEHRNLWSTTRKSWAERDFERRQEIVNAMGKRSWRVQKLRKKPRWVTAENIRLQWASRVLSKSQIEMQKNIEQLSEIGKNMRDDLNKLIE